MITYDNFNKLSSKLSVLGLPIENVTLNDAADMITDFLPRHVDGASSENPRKYYFVNANSINACYRQSQLAAMLLRADCLFADGIGMRLAAKKLGNDLIDNVNGTDLLPLLCQRAASKQQRVFLLGAKDGVAQRAADKLVAEHPDLQIVGTHHGYISATHPDSLINLINDTQPDIVLVAMGTPIQESWIDSHSHRLHCSAVLAVGGLFDFFSGNIPRAPAFMRKHGLEWVFRLFQEPVNKFNRYVVGVPEFLFRLFISNKTLIGAK